MPRRSPALPSRSLAPLLAAGALALACAGASLAQPGAVQQKPFKSGAGPDELWEVSMKMEMPGMPMALPGQTFQTCLKKGRNGSEDAIPRDSRCKVSDVTNAGGRTTFAIDCAGDEPMSGRGEIAGTPASYDGRMTMKSKRPGENLEVTQVFAGRKVGACTEQ